MTRNTKHPNTFYEIPQRAKTKTVEKKKLGGMQAFNFSFITWEKKNPSPDEEMMYRTDVQYAYLKFKI